MFGLFLLFSLAGTRDRILVPSVYQPWRPTPWNSNRTPPEPHQLGARIISPAGIDTFDGLVPKDIRIRITYNVHSFRRQERASGRGREPPRSHNQLQTETKSSRSEDDQDHK